MSYKRRATSWQITTRTGGGTDSMHEDADDSGQDAAVDLQAWWDDLRIAGAFLTRLPIPTDQTPNLRGLARASRTFPLVGLGIGLMGGIVYAVADRLSLGGPLAAIIAVTTVVAATGALHEDGLADVADGFGAGRDRDAKLRIMRDSRIGTFGVVALVSALALRVAAIAAIGAVERPVGVIAALVACHAASRAFVAIVMQREPLARDDGLAAAAGRPSAVTSLWALGLGIGIALICERLSGVVALAVGIAVAWGVASLARRQIGGHTGDVLGTVQQASEIGMLLALAALA
jgi:adenosylcobinamide-GDP ribazoletransferase